MRTDRAGSGAMPPARVISVVVAITLTATLFAFPFVLGRELTGAAHGWVTLLLLGLCGAWVHGLGYVPDRRALAILTGPMFVWPTIALAAVMLATAAKP